MRRLKHLDHNFLLCLCEYTTMNSDRKRLLTDELDELNKIKSEVKRKTFHEEKMAKLEKDPSHTIERLKRIRQKYLNMIADRL